MDLSPVLVFAIALIRPSLLVVGTPLFGGMQTIAARRSGQLSQLLIIFVNGYNHHLNRSQSWRQHKTLIIAVCHDQSSHQTRRYSPACGPGILELILSVDEFDVERLGEVYGMAFLGVMVFYCVGVVLLRVYQPAKVARAPYVSCSQSRRPFRIAIGAATAITTNRTAW